MKMAEVYTIGIDFGTLSGRAVLANVKTGEIISASSYLYPHGVMDKSLPDGTPLAQDWALQYPEDYIEALYHTIAELLKKSNVYPESVIGIGINFTSSTLIPVKSDGTPLNKLPQFQKNPHAYVKLWKHHSAQPWADKINASASERSEKWLKYYGGKLSSEWMLPKIFQILDESPDVFNAMDFFVEGSDWIVWHLTGKLVRNIDGAGYKALWSNGCYPSNAFLRSLDPRLEHLYETKMSGDVIPLGTRVGNLRSEIAQKLGLTTSTIISAGMNDGVSPAPAMKLSGSGNVMVILGTSMCYFVLADTFHEIPGVCGIVRDGILPGYFCYETGQASGGDILDWFTKNAVPSSCHIAAEKSGADIKQYLTEQISHQHPGESGLLALDWFNGNRTPLKNSYLSGLIIGLTLTSSAAEIYRALMESIAFGARRILENYKEHGVDLDSITVTGGIPHKNPFFMQLYADILKLPIYLADKESTSALGSAIFAAVAAGSSKGGYNDIFKAASAMGRTPVKQYLPNCEYSAIYDALYSEYTLLFNYFGHGTNEIMLRLKKLQSSINR